MSNQTSPKPFVFVLMPFAPEFDDLYKLAIKEAAKKAKCFCERVDEQEYDGAIIDRICSQISKADIIVGVVTGQNPNVFYEIGYAHALGKRVFLLTSEVDDIPFDLRHQPHIVYSNSLESLQNELLKKLKWAINNPTSVDTSATQLSCKLNGVALDAKAVPRFELKCTNVGGAWSGSFRGSLVLNNVSDTTIEDMELEVVLKCPRQFQPVNLVRDGPTAIEVESGHIWQFPPLERMYPSVVKELVFEVIYYAEDDTAFPRVFSAFEIVFHSAASSVSYCFSIETVRDDTFPMEFHS